MRQLNLRLFVILALIFAVLGAGVYAAHTFQVRRTASSLLKQADQAEAAMKKAQADVAKLEADPASITKQTERLMSLLGRYLRYRPDDEQALKRYALLQSKLVEEMQSSRAQQGQAEAVLAVLNRALGFMPGDEDLTRHAMRLSMIQRRFGEASGFADKLNKQKANDAEAEFTIARCLVLDNKAPEAVPWYEKALEHDPTLVDAYLGYTVMLRDELKDTAKAREVIDKLTAANPESAQAHLIRAMYLQESVKEGDPGAEEVKAAAAKDAERALELEPKYPNAMLVVAQQAAAQKDWDRARQILRDGIESYPLEEKFYMLLARVEGEAEADKVGEARPSYSALPILKEAARKMPSNLRVKAAMASILIDKGIDQEVPDETKQEALQEATTTVDDLEIRGADKGLVGYLRGRLAMARKEWRQAQRALSTAATLLVTVPEMSQRAELLLAECYGRLGEPDRQYDIYRRLASESPDAPGAHARVAESLESMGRYQQALEEYRLESEKTPELLVAIARAQILRNLSLLPAQRRWEEVEAALQEAEKAAVGDPRLPVLRAEMLAAQDRMDEAIKLVEEARTANPKEHLLWNTAYRFAVRAGRTADLKGIVDEAEKALGDTGNTRVLRARYLAAYGGDDKLQQIDKLAEGFKDQSQEDKLILASGVVDAHMRAGDNPGALAQWRRFAEGVPGDLAAQAKLFELALAVHDTAAQSQALERIQKIEGSDSPLSLYLKARELTGKAEDETNETARNKLLQQAREVLIQAGIQRPSWSAIPRVQGELEELLGKEAENQRAAVEYYLQAIDLGERDMTVVRQALELLTRLGRYDEARKVLASIQEQSTVSGEMQRLASEISFRNQDRTRALELAEQRVAEGTTDVLDYIWLGFMRLAVGRRIEAEEPFRKALEIGGPGDPRAQFALVQYLTASKQLDKAKEAVAAAEAPLQAAGQQTALAQCYELVGEAQRARGMYEELRQSKPEDIGLLRNLAAFLVRQNQLQEAEPYLKQLIDQQSRSPDDARWAKDLLVRILATDLDETRARQALAVLGLNPEQDIDMSQIATEPMEDLRMKARVLAAQQDPKRKEEGAALLREIIAREPQPSSTGNEQVLLARVYELQGDWAHADETMLELLRRDQQTPRYRVEYIQALIRNDRADQADRWLDELDELANGPGGTPRDKASLVQLRAQVLSSQKKPAEAVALLRAYADETAKESPERLLAVSLLMEQIKQIQPAEELLRKYVDENKEKRPDIPLLLVAFLGRQGRTREAMDLLEPFWKEDWKEENIASAVLSTTFTVASSARVDQHDQLSRADGWLQDKITQSPENMELQTSRAVLRSIEGRYSESETIYREVLAKDPKNLVALNNLAWLLTLRDGQSQGTMALELIERAVQIAGPKSALLDTRGVINLTLGRLNQAVRDIEAAITTGPESPMFFHLARAQLALNRKDQAKVALRDGKRAGLTQDKLDPLERELYPKIMAEAGSEP